MNGELGVRREKALFFGKNSAGEARQEEIAVEAPLEVRIAGERLAITMRTPGQDRELVLGFLIAEGLLALADDASALPLELSLDADGSGVADAALTGAALERSRGRLAKRGTLTTSACGVCGRGGIDDLLEALTPLADPSRFERATLARLTDLLSKRQPLFRRTGGLHAAALADRAGELQVVHEDVGRHNAVDKVVGATALARRLPEPGSLLVVS